MSGYILGLDLGTNSIGWALLEHQDGQPRDLTGIGVRVFQEAVETKTRAPKNRARRAARLARRQLARKRKRREGLLASLTQSGLLPSDPPERSALFCNSDPFQLRARGLDERLTLYEFGRALFHLNKRRGFQSNRKTAFGKLAEEYREFIAEEDAAEIKEAEKKDKKADENEGVVKAAIATLRKRMTETGARTLGEHLSTLDRRRNRRNEFGLYTEREMSKEEFETLWEAQRRHHPDMLADALKVKLHNVIFHQRPLKIQKFLVGPCQFEPSRKRSMRALLEAQRFRTLQDINNLTVRDPVSQTYRPLNEVERNGLIEALEHRGHLTWNQVRKQLGLHGGETFNLEEGRTKDKLIGNQTAVALRKALPGYWDEWPAEKQSEFVGDYLSFTDRSALLNRLANHWMLPKHLAYQAATLELEPGYFHLSRKAIVRILPLLEQGMNYHDACQAAGYQRDDQKQAVCLPFLDEPPALRNLRNPVVKRALYEARRVVNAIVREYGKPDLIRIELARDLKLTKKKKDALEKQNRTNRKLNEEADEKLKEMGIAKSSRDDRIKYRLWNECSLCPYTGQPISMEMLFNPAEVEIDHILPYSRSLDDSYMNKTLCLASANREKLNQTPHEAFSADPLRYEQVLQRVTKLPFSKRRRFAQKEIKTDEFIARQLNDTRYISVEVRDYLERLGVKVEPVQGGTTAALRRSWGLNHILAVDGSGEKNRADHRHHAIDALVVALTSVRLLQFITRLSGEQRAILGERGFLLPAPWHNFKEDVTRRIGSLIVSHAPSRKISGAFHEETAYGRGSQDGKTVYVHRVPLASLTSAQVKKIRDPRVRQLVEGRLMDFGGDGKKAFAQPLHHADGKTLIHKVRIIEKFSESSVHGIKSGRKTPYKYVKLGSNHHAEIIENVKTGKRKGVFVTTLEAARRARIAKVPIVQRDHGPDYKFIMCLMVNDMVEIEENGVKLHYRIQILDGANKKIIFRLHTAATLDDNETRLIKTPNSLQGQKLEVDPLGQILGYGT